MPVPAIAAGGTVKSAAKPVFGKSSTQGRDCMRNARKAEEHRIEKSTEHVSRSRSGVFRSRALVFCAFFAAVICLIFVPETARAAVNPQAVSLAAKNVLENASVVKTSKGYICKENNKRRVLKNKWVTINGSVYYFNSKGYAQTGEFEYKECRYFAGADAKVYVSRWRYVNGSKTYYYGKTAAQLRSCWCRIKSEYYYFKKDGSIARNTWIGAYFVRRNGTRVQGLKRTKNTTSSAEDGKEQESTSGTNGKWGVSEEKKLIILGASRVVQMQAAVSSDEDILYICQSGAGYSWLTRCGLPELRAYLSVYPNSKVVFQFGNNDTGKSQDCYFTQYSALYKQLIAEYPSTSFYFMDILPANLKRCKSKNAKAKEFNTKLKAAFPRTSKGGYIGGYSWMVSNGFGLKDKYHYDDETYRRIYRYILKKVSWQ